MTTERPRHHAAERERERENVAEQQALGRAPARPAAPDTISPPGLESGTSRLPGDESDPAGLARSDHELFFSLMSHELRTPLAAVLGYLEMLVDDCASMRADQRDLLARASGQARHLCRLVEDLLSLGDAGDRPTHSASAPEACRALRPARIPGPTRRDSAGASRIRSREPGGTRQGQTVR